MFEPEKESLSSILDTLYKVDLFNLTIYADSEADFNKIPLNIIDLFLYAYHGTYMKYIAQVEGSERSRISPSEVLLLDLVLTHDAEVFRALYHSPDKFDDLPKWVVDYVNSKEGIYVVFLDESSMGENLDRAGVASHEITHIFIPQIVGAPLTYLSEVWGTWLNEGLVVALNQLQSIDWMKDEVEKIEFRDISIKDITNNGLFFYDKRKVKENFAYQYCAWIALELGEAISLAENYSYKVGPSPLEHIIISTAKAYHEEYDFWNYLEKLGVTIKGCEERFRAKLME